MHLKNDLVVILSAICVTTRISEKAAASNQGDRNKNELNALLYLSMEKVFLKRVRYFEKFPIFLFGRLCQYHNLLGDFSTFL